MTKSVFHALYALDQAAAMKIRATLMLGLSQWFAQSDMTQAAAAKVLGITQARVPDIRRGCDQSFQSGFAGVLGGACRVATQVEAGSLSR